MDHNMSTWHSKARICHFVKWQIPPFNIFNTLTLTPIAPSLSGAAQNPFGSLWVCSRTPPLTGETDSAFSPWLRVIVTAARYAEFIKYGTLGFGTSTLQRLCVSVCVVTRADPGACVGIQMADGEWYLMLVAGWMAGGRDGWRTRPCAETTVQRPDILLKHTKQHI